MNSLYDIVREGKVFFELSENNVKIDIIPLQSNAQWDRITSELETDVYFYSKYMLSFDSYSEGLGFAVYVKSPSGASYFEPFRVRKINIEGFQNYCDVSSEYGYAGPVCTGDGVFADSVLAALKSFFQRHSVVSVFVRYHPILKNEQIVSKYRNIINCNPTVSIDTSVPFDDILANLDLKKRSNYKRAIKKGTSVRYGSDADIPTFYDLYIQSMDHAHASEFYLLSEDFFRNTLKNLPGNSFMLIAEFGGIAVGASLFLFSKDMMHYHFSGKNCKDPSASKANGTTVIICEAARIASEKGIKEFHLGGGVGGASNDSLFNFKKDFSNQTRTFYISKDVENLQVYSDICKKEGIDAKQETFFPAYRAQK